MLVCALGGIGYSIGRLLRPASAPTPHRHALWASPFPRAIGYASIAIIGVTTGVWFLTQSAWISSGRVHAARKSQVLRNPLDSSSSSSAVTSNDPQFSSALQIGSVGKMQIGGTAMDKQGNTYIAGAFFGSVTFNTKPQATTLNSTEDYDVFVAKYDSTGQPVWARMANGATGLTYVDPTTKFEEHYSLDGALSLAVDAQGNAYVGGGFVSSLSFKDASGNTVATLGDSDPDINFELFIAKYDTAGKLVWARGGMSNASDNTAGEEDLDSAVNGITDIVLDKAGNPYVAGTFSGTNFLGRSVTNNGQRDVLLSRLDPATGNPVWVSTPGSSGIDAATGLTIDDNANIYIIGDVGATITFPTQPQPTTLTVDDTYGDSFIAKYDGNGQALWAKQIAGDQPIAGEHIAISGAGNLYLTGAFADDVKFDSISVTDPSDGSGMSGFLTKYDMNGNAQWARIFGHYNGENPDGDVYGYRVETDKAGTPYVLGTFDKEATFGIESPAMQQTLMSMGREDNFIAHYDAAGNYQWVKQLAESNGVSTNTLGDTKNVPVEVVPLRIVYNDASNTFTVTGDFLGALALDRLKLDSGSDIRSYIATLPVSSAQFSATDYIGNKTDGSIAITVTRTGDTSGTASVDYATQDNTATQTRDYITAFGTLVFNPGETSKTFTVLLTNNNYADGDKSLNIVLSNATNGLNLSAPPVATLVIHNPNTTPPTTNPVDDPRLFVRQHYLDFLNRTPDQSGLDYWSGQITSCGADPVCINRRRVSVSAAYFIELEFQTTGSYVYRMYKAAYGVRPTYAQFMPDRVRINPNADQIDSSKQAFADLFVSRPEFVVRYPASLTGEQFIDALLASVKQNSSVDLSSQRASLVTDYNQNQSRSRIVRLVAENQALQTAEYNKAFVLMQYFGYLRRDPDDSGYNFWLSILNNKEPNNFRGMVCAFINSAEYQQRFSSVVTRNDSVCSNLGQ